MFISILVETVYKLCCALFIGVFFEKKFLFATYEVGVWFYY